MATETHRLTDIERANLVAYLDGELNEAEVRDLGTKITQSVTARREIDSLKKTWELLDFLPRPEPPHDFPGRTATLAFQQEPDRGAWLASVGGRFAPIVARTATLLGVAAATVAIGFALTRWVWPDPSGRLVRDLPIAEHLDEYREVGSIEFLKLLASSPHFSEDAE
jgi:hypothetical protein